MNIPAILCVLLLTLAQVKARANSSSSAENTTAPAPAPAPPGSVAKYHECDCGVPMFPVSRIVNGQPTRREEFPWFVSLFAGRSFRQPPKCGGSLLTDRHVVTAAHCLTYFSGLSPSNTYALVGAHNWTDRYDTRRSQLVRVWAGYPMSTFNMDKFDGDVAVLELEQPVELNAWTYPICLPPLNFTLQHALPDQALVIGYGRLWALTAHQTGPQPQELYKTVRNLRLVDGPPCSADPAVSHAFRRSMPLSDRQMCAYGDNTDSCQGDSGGPLMYFDRRRYRYYLVGIVSYGAMHCNAPHLPGFYTKVLHPSIRNYLACNIKDGVTCRH